MKVLAMHFGHDSAISLITENGIESCQLSERIKRCKLFIGINDELLNHFFEAHNLTVDEIDCIALTSTQREDLYIENNGVLDVRYERHPDDAVPSLIEEYLNKEGHTPEDYFLGLTPKEKELRLRRVIVPHAINPLFRDKANGFKFMPWMDMAKVNHDTPYAPIDDIVDSLVAKKIDFAPGVNGFHYPATATLYGKSMPCYIVNHHACHAASSYYCSRSNNSAVFTADGGAGGMRGGWFFHGIGHQVQPLAPHHLEIGGLYSQTSRSILKLGGSPDGKMMGLAPYGKPTLFSDEFCGNAADFTALQNAGKFPKSEEFRYAWHEHLLQKAKDAGYDMSELGNQEKILEPVNADIAATLQHILEITVLRAAGSLKRLMTELGTDADTLCLAGGSMLNCPSNTNIYNASLFENVFVPPFTDDSGCAIGAGLWVYHNLLSQPVTREPGDLPVTPYLGNHTKEGTIEQSLKGKEQFQSCKVENLGNSVATDLMEDKVIAFFNGRSEIGPRALGNRTLISDPRKAENWERVNRLKTRELWRPFAPAILKEHFDLYFKNGPDDSPYMLFNSTVLENNIPAVTHVDNTSRVQTVTSENGEFHEVIQSFYEMSNCPVVMNTSFNGPGEPIMETPDQALAFLEKAEDEVVLYMDGWRVTKSAP